jgi:hypothetical protein
LDPAPADPEAPGKAPLDAAPLGARLPGAELLGSAAEVLLLRLDCPAVQALSATAMITAPAAIVRVAFRKSMGELRWVVESFANEVPTANAGRASPPVAVLDYCLASPRHSSWPEVAS